MNEPKSQPDSMAIPAVAEGRARPAPRPPYRPAIPALRRGSSPVPPLKAASGLEPASYVGDELAGERILIYTIHDGRRIPAYLSGTDQPALSPAGHPEGGQAEYRPSTRLRRDPRIHRAYRTERDWGANLLAGHLARHLGLGGYLKVELARVLLDFGRLPGRSPAGVAHLKRKAIFPPAGDLLPAAATGRLLGCYDRLEAIMTRRLADKALSIAIHTYDPLDDDGKLRPELALITGRAAGAQTRQFGGVEKPTPAAESAYDPLFPMDLREATCDSALSCRVISNLERSGRQVALNHPYDLHEGSVELRAQGRFFFRYLRRRFNQALPGAESASHLRVWSMLADIAQRRPASRALHRFLHRSQPAPAGHEWECADGRRAYREIARFLDAHRSELTQDYRFVHDRPSTLVIEVRKDLLCELDNDGAVAGLRLDAQQVARDVARQLAAAVAGYLRRDLATSTRPIPELRRLRKRLRQVDNRRLA